MNPEIFFSPRSGHWGQVRAEHLKTEAVCQACGSPNHLNVHHIMPFHINPSLELDPKNLITLCETPSVNCHFLFGHKKNWTLYVPNVREVVLMVRLTFLKST